MANNNLALYLESSSDYRITKEVGRKKSTISVADAKALWDAGLVGGWNVAFQRLASADFNLDAVRAYYDSKRKVSV